ncbi:MAG: hypothetical protein U0871_16145 [Gemmataceae bacterium]
MIRPILALTVGGLALVPAGAVAFGQRRPSCPPPQPVVYCPPPVVYVPVCPPVCCPPAVVTPAAPAAPTVQQESPPTASPPKAEAAPKPASPAVPAPGLPGGLGNKPAESPPAGVKPIGFTEQAPEPKPADPPTIPAVGLPAEPSTPPTRPLVVPTPTPGIKDTPPASSAPTLQTPPAPALPTPAAPTPLTIPSAGPAKSDAGLTIPQLKPVAPDAGVPPLTLPTPGEPSTRTSQSSPLTGARRSFDMYPVDGPAPASPTAQRTVGFFNQSNRDVKLTVEGQSVTLPRGHQVSAVVPGGFKWKLDGGPEQKTDVPTAAPGLDVVIRQ